MQLEVVLEEIVERRTKRITLRLVVPADVASTPVEVAEGLVSRIGSDRRIGPKPSPLLIVGPVRRVAWAR